MGTRKVRVWLDELPGILLETKKALRFRREAQACSDSSERVLGVEMMVASGPRIMYGLLGASFRPDSSGFTESIIPILGEKQGEFSSPVAPTYDRIFWHYPEEYAEATRRAIAASGSLPSGVLDFKCAASADVGSCRVIFAQITGVIIAAIKDHLDGSGMIDLALRHDLAWGASVC